jgi:iron complex outermembrane receptor protein
MKNLKVALCAASSLTVALWLATPAFAENQPTSADQATTATPSTNATAKSNGGLSEIVVTAQRKSESVLDVPMSIQASTGDQLRSQGINQITDLQFTTPGYNVSDSNGYTQVFIRGVGNAVYSTGGVINIITRQPDLDETHADVRLSYGEHNTVDAAGYLTIPIITDKVAFNISGERRYSDAYFPNLAPATFYTPAMFPTGLPLLGLNSAQTANSFNEHTSNQNVGNQNFYAVDGKLLIKPSDRFKLTLDGDYSNKDDSQGNAGWQNSPAYEQQQFLGLLGFIAGELGGTVNPAAFPANFIQGNPPKFKVSNGTPGFVRLKDWGVSGTAVFSTDTVDFTSITAYRQQHTQFIDDLGASTLAFTAALVDNHKHYFYQELRALSHFDGPFQFVAGGSYLDNDTKYYTDVYLFGGVLPASPTARSTDKVKNWSIYAQGSYDFTDKLSLTASGRYVHESNTAQFYELVPNAFGAPDGPPVSASESKFLPSATLSYKLTDGGNIYLRYARGFKSGGVNPVANASAFVVDGVYYASSGSLFKGETVDTFEGGYKGQFFDHKVHVTAAVFYNNYKDLQTAGHVKAQFAQEIILTTVNAPSARTYGVEGTVDWRVIPPLTLSATAGYLNAKYKDFAVPETPLTNAFDLSGHQMINSPEFQMSFGANLDQPVSNSINLIANGLLTHSSSTLWQISGAPCSQVPGGVSGVTCLPDSIGNPYWLVNARIGIKTSDDRFRLEVFANNLFNAAYTTYGNSNAANTTQFNWGYPRIIGVEATMHL